MFRLDGKVAIVTGAARGQGAATARVMARQGARVILADVLHEQAQSVAREIGDAAAAIRLDVRDQENWRSLVAEVQARHGRVDILVNNAAITDATPFLETSRARLEEVLHTNLVGVYLGMQAVIPAMIAQKRGAIINISSVNGLRGTASVSCYDASKWAVRGVTKSVALEFAHLGIRVNSIHPGAIDTPMLNPTNIDVSQIAQDFQIPGGRVGRPEEVAHASLFLASDEASYVNGAELAVDGGWSAGTYLVGLERMGL